MQVAGSRLLGAGFGVKDVKEISRRGRQGHAKVAEVVRMKTVTFKLKTVDGKLKTTNLLHPPLPLDLLVGFLHFSELVLRSLAVGFIHVLQLVGVVFLSHASIGLLDISIGGRLVYFEDLIGVVCRLEEHGLDAFKIFGRQPEVPGNILDLPGFGLTYLAVGVGDAEQEVGDLKPGLVAGTGHEVLRDAGLGEFPVLDDLIKGAEYGIGPFLSVGLNKVRTHVIQFRLTHRTVGLYDKGGKREQVKLKILG